MYSAKEIKIISDPRLTTSQKAKLTGRPKMGIRSKLQKMRREKARNEIPLN